ncbi:unnamed protein product, partial [Oppiella nova]
MASICFKRFNHLLSKLETSVEFNRCLLRAKNGTKGSVRKSHAFTGYREWNWEPNRPYIQRLMHFHAALMWCYIYWSFRHNWRELV